MQNQFKRLVTLLPSSFQQEMRRLHFARLRRKHRFVSREREFNLLSEWVMPGDWVIDVGANVGHYTRALSECVGRKGRVIAFEPIAKTFELLAASVADLTNVTLVGAAASDQTKLAGLNIPTFEWGLENFYEASIREGASDCSALCLPIDSLGLASRVRFLKIDAEGHEAAVLRGAEKLLLRDRPLLLVEDNSPEVREWLWQRGFEGVQLSGSSNRIYRPVDGTADKVGKLRG